MSHSVFVFDTSPMFSDDDGGGMGRGGCPIVSSQESVFRPKADQGITVTLDNPTRAHIPIH